MDSKKRQQSRKGIRKMIRDMEYNRRRWIEVELRKSRAKRVIDVYVKMMLSGKTDLNKLAEMYRPNSLKPIATLNRFLKQREVKEVISQKLDEALKLHGIDVDFVLKKRLNQYRLNLN